MSLIEKITKRSIYEYIVGWIVIISILSILHTILTFNGILPLNFDTIWFDNILYNTINGNGFFYVLPNHYDIGINTSYTHHFQGHNQPILFLFLPVYYIFQSIYTILLIQVAVIGLAAIPLYLIGKEIVGDKVAKIISISYLLYPIIIWNTIRFHPISFAPLFIFSLIYFYKKEKFSLYVIFLLLSLSLKENVCLVLISLSLFFVYDGVKTKYLAKDVSSKLRYIITSFVLSIIWVYISLKIILPHSVSLGRYSHLGESFNEILLNIFSNPYLFVNEIFSLELLFYFLGLFLPVFFSPLFSISTFLFSTPILLQNILFNSPSMLCFYYQYQFNVIPFLFLSVIFGIHKLSKRVSTIKFERYMKCYFYMSIFSCILFSVYRVAVFMVRGI